MGIHFFNLLCMTDILFKQHLAICMYFIVIDVTIFIHFIAKRYLNIKIIYQLESQDTYSVIMDRYCTI